VPFSKDNNICAKNALDFIAADSPEVFHTEAQGEAAMGLSEKRKISPKVSETSARNSVGPMRMREHDAMADEPSIPK
jgi:hypothetical protein